jgi:hypothetical protein
MTTRKHDSSFPVFDSKGRFIDGDDYSSRGLTKREYFAAKALQGILSNPSLDPDEYNPSAYANLALEAAEILIIELNKVN